MVRRWTEPILTEAIETEICVLGGGPAGATAACKLASLGHSVLVVERAFFPRPHVGEALAPGIWPQLDLLGFTEKVIAAGFYPTRAARVRWSGPHAETVRHPDPPGLMVDRGRFDQLLLEHAREAGARLLQTALARALHRTGSGWTVSVRTREGERPVHARFLVDARGRSSPANNRREPTGPLTLALYGTWECRDGWASWGGWDGETRIEAGPDEWLWAAPRPDGSLSAMVFVGAERYRAARAAGVSLEAFYRDLLARSALLARIPEAELQGRVHLCDASCWNNPEPSGEGFLKVGEAAFTLDPLSSTGVQKAMQTAWSGAIAVHTILTQPGNGEAAERFYRENQRTVVDRHAGWAAGYYATAERPAGSPFWERRAAAAPESERSEAASAPLPQPRDTRLRLSAEAALVATPCVTGDLIATRPALVHPRLERPVAFLDGIEIAPLLAAIPPEVTLEELTARWSQRLPQAPPPQVAALAGWLIRHEILVPD